MRYYQDSEGVDFSELRGAVLTSIVIDKEGDEVRFETKAGESYVMYHEQDCCETVWLEDVNGDMDDLVGEPILLAEGVSQGGESEDDWGSSTWTFYKIATIKGTVVMRWIGESNGYYSESVDFVKLYDKGTIG